MEWMTCCENMIGRGHSSRGTCCQDRTRSLSLHGVQAVALSDGAGSKPLSQEGAEAAVHAACQLLCERFDFFSTEATPMQMRREMLGAVRSAIHTRAMELGAADDALSCTLLAVACRGDRYLLIHVGDGVIGYRKGGRTLVASAPDNGEYANTTVFVTSENAIGKCRVMRGTQPEIEGFVLMSDGCEAALYRKKQKRLAPLVGKLVWRTALLRDCAAQEWLHLALEVTQQCTLDDCSLAVLAKGRSDAHSLAVREQADLLGICTQNKNRRRRSLRKARKDFRSN